MKGAPEFPMFGAVYFRKTNPPREDWDRDYARAAADGHTIFRHWVPWSAVETAPGKYDWDDYDRHLELGASHGIRAVLAEISTNYPEWLYHSLPEARLEDRHGHRRNSGMHVSCVVGGNHSLCMDNPEVAEACGRFLTAMARRYSGHSGLLAWDIWNECSMYSPDLLCYCPATEREFRAWLRDRYGDLASLGRAWKRYSYTDWVEVRLPRELGPYPDVLDRIEFHNDRAFHWMKWRADVIRKADPGHPVTAHGNAKTFSDMAPACGDDFRAGEIADAFGYTYWHGNDCEPFLAVDMIRSASRGKEFWRAEAVGDSEWAGRDRVNSPMPWKDRMHDPENIRLDAMVALAGGATAYMNPRWRPLLDGPLFGAYGWYGMDGSPTERSAMVSSLAKWAAEPGLKGLWRARPVRGDVAILLLEEAQADCYARHGSTAFYSDSVKGAYQAFLEAGIQCDFTKIGGIGDYRVVYAPFPVAMKDATVTALTAWAEAGGTLVCEACPGYFDAHAHAFPVQPSRGLDRVFGCREAAVAFAPDLGQYFSLSGGPVRVSLYRQSYVASGGQVAAAHGDGSPGLVINACGKGKGVLLGGMAGYAYRHWPCKEAWQWFGSLPSIAGEEPALKVSVSSVTGRIWKGDGGRFLWLVNRDASPAAVKVRVSPSVIRQFRAVALRSGGHVNQNGGLVEVEVPGRDAVILHLA